MTEEKSRQHVGRKIERIRTLRGMKQEALAIALGLTQGAISRMEQSEQVDDEKLKSVADALGVTVDTIKNFDENMLLGTSNFFNPHFQDHAMNIINQFNPIEKLMELFEENRKLYERLLESERKRIELLEALLRDKGDSKR